MRTSGLLLLGRAGASRLAQDSERPVGVDQVVALVRNREALAFGSRTSSGRQFGRTARVVRDRVRTRNDLQPRGRPREPSTARGFRRGTGNRWRGDTSRFASLRGRRGGPLKLFQETYEMVACVRGNLFTSIKMHTSAEAPGGWPLVSRVGGGVVGPVKSASNCFECAPRPETPPGVRGVTSFLFPALCLRGPPVLLLAPVELEAAAVPAPARGELCVLCAGVSKSLEDVDQVQPRSKMIGVQRALKV